jgi:flagellin
MPSADLTRIASNIGALNALDSLRKINGQLGVAQLRLSTGKRINSASDDPAGFFIATTLNARTQGMRVALDNIGDAKNVLSIAEGGLQKISDILLQMRSKIQQAGSSSLSMSQRNAIGTQLDQYQLEINSIVKGTTFNDIDLIGKASNACSTGLTFQVGPGNVAADDQVTLDIQNDVDKTKAFDATGLGVWNTTGCTVSASASAAMTYMGTLDKAIGAVSSALATVGAYQARLTFKEDSTTVSVANNEAAYNRIMNADMAQEQVNATKFQILQQVATAMLTQANAAPQAVLSLFK